MREPLHWDQTVISSGIYWVADWVVDWMALGGGILSEFLQSYSLTSPPPNNTYRLYLWGGRHPAACLHFIA